MFSCSNGLGRPVTLNQILDKTEDAIGDHTPSASRFKSLSLERMLIERETRRAVRGGGRDAYQKQMCGLHPFTAAPRKTSV
jgi:hypothetical protein